MGAEFTIQQVVESEEWPGNDETMRTQELLFEGDNRTYNLIGKASFDAKVNGDTLYGFKDDKSGKFIPQKRPGGGGRASGGSGGGGARDASIERQVAAKVAGEITVAALTTGKATDAAGTFAKAFDLVVLKITGAPLHVTAEEESNC